MYRRAIWALALLGTFGGAAEAAKKIPTKRLRISTTPAKAEVYLDDVSGRPIGVTPVRVSIPYGFHELIVMLDGYKTERVKLNIDRNTKNVALNLVRLGRLRITNTKPVTIGAQVLVDGRPVGLVPYEGFIVPGRHQVTVIKDGHSTFSEWVELRAKELFALTVDLEPASSKTGTLFVAADVDGGVVRVDGVERGTTPTSIELPEGPVLVEIRIPGLPAWTKTYVIEANKKVIAQAKLRPDAGPTGKLLVISSVPGTLVYVDGTKTGTAPVTLAAISPGTHVVEGTKRGFDRAQSTVKVNVNEQSVVKLQLAEAKEIFGRIAVRSSVPGATVYLDGSSRGLAPLEVSDVRLGRHAVTVRRSGYVDFKAQCVVEQHKPCRVVAELTPLARVRVVAKPMKGRVFVDGKSVGEVPYEGLLTAETHMVKVEATDYETAEQTVELVRSEETREIRFDLRPSETSTMAVAKREATAYAKRKITYRGATSFTGVPLGPGMSTIDFFVGAPYLLEIRGGVGLLDDLAAGIGFRFLERDVSLGVAELVLRVHTGRRLVGALSVGAQGELFLGTDFSKTATFGGAVRGLATLHFGDVGAFTLILGGDVSHDRFKDLPGVAAPGSDVDNQTVSRIFTGANATWWASQTWAFTLAFDVSLGGDDRLLYKKVFFGAIDEDPRVGFHLGATFAF